MSYTDLIEEEGVNSQFLAVIKPAIRITNWTNVSSTIYKNTFTHGHVFKVVYEGTVLAEVTSLPGPNEFWWDYDNDTLYVNIGTTISTQFITVFFEIYAATGTRGGASHWYRDPLDSNTRTVYYDPIINKPPSFKATLSDALFGFMPVQSTSIILANAEHSLEDNLWDVSYVNKDINVYHWLGELSTSNIKLVMKGKMQNVSYSWSTITINILDRVNIFDKEYRNPSKSFYNTTDFPNVDPAFIGRPIRYVYGRADEILCVNVDYEVDNPTTSENRDFAVRADGSNQNTLQYTVPASPASTNTRTYLNDTDGLNVGDQVYLDKATDEYPIITNVDRTSNYIEHAALSSGAAASGDTVDRSTVGNVFLEQGGVIYQPLFNRDWTEVVVNGVILIRFNSSMESNLSINTLDGSEIVYCRCYGKQNNVTLGGSPFGSDSEQFRALTNPAVIMFDLLKRLGITESEIDTATFNTLSSSIGAKDAGFAIPKVNGSDFPTYKDLFLDLMATTLTRIYLNGDLKWEVSEISKFGTADYDIEIDELLDFNYSFDYKDIVSDVIVNYDYREYSDSYLNETSSSNEAEYLHEIQKQKSHVAIYLNSTDASSLASDLRYIWGERSGKLQFRTKNRLFPVKISDIINVKLYTMPGQVYSSGTLREQKGVAIDVDKGLREVTITLDDQKGVEEGF